jgi:ABC-2 type transport system ATP-binding protein
VICAKEITFNYKNKPLFKDLNLNLECGNIIGLFGKNGAGKTSLLKLLTGLLKPNEGHFNIDTYTPFHRYPDFLQDIYFISEEMYQPDLCLKRYIKLYASFYKNFDHSKIQRILEEFELKNHHNLQQISFGQKKKFMIAFALSTNCKYLFLDEPTNGLDIPSKSIFRKVLVNSVDENQLVMISTHQVKDIENLIDDIVILNNGKIVLHKDINSVSKKIQFKSVTNTNNYEDIIYKEKSLEGYKVMLPMKGNTETKIDLELLFNAVVNDTNINF